MSKGSKRPGWRTVEARYKRIGRELHAAAEAERKRKLLVIPAPSAVNAVADANNRARATKSVAICVRCARNPATFTAHAGNGSWDAICRACITLDDRWYCGKFPCGLVYADRAIEVHGDYKRVAFLPYSSLVLEIADPNSPLIERVKSDAAALQARRGQVFAISTCGQTDAAAGYATGQTVILGAKC